MTQKTSLKPLGEITDQQVDDAELTIRNHWPKAKNLGRQQFRAELKDVLTLARDYYFYALKAGSSPAKRRELETLRRAIAVVRGGLGRKQVKRQIADCVDYPAAIAGDREKAYEAWSEPVAKIERLHAALLETEGMIDQGLEKNSKNTEAAPRHNTNAIVMAAGAIWSQVEHWGIPSDLWHRDMTSSPAVSIIVGVLDILGIKSSERAIAALKPETDPDFHLPVLVIPTRARGKRR